MKTVKIERKPQHGNKSYKEEPHGNFSTNTITETKISLYGLSTRMEVTEEKL